MKNKTENAKISERWSFFEVSKIIFLLNTHVSLLVQQPNYIILKKVYFKLGFIELASQYDLYTLLFNICLFDNVFVKRSWAGDFCECPDL